jgi:hypothetical protein
VKQYIPHPYRELRQWSNQTPVIIIYVGPTWLAFRHMREAGRCCFRHHFRRPLPNPQPLRRHREDTTSHWPLKSRGACNRTIWYFLSSKVLQIQLQRKLSISFIRWYNRMLNSWGAVHRLPFWAEWWNMKKDCFHLLTSVGQLWWSLTLNLVAIELPARANLVQLPRQLPFQLRLSVRRQTSIYTGKII